MAIYNPIYLDRPKDLGEALEILSEFRGKAKLVGGNTSIYQVSRDDSLADIERLIDLSRLGLSYIRKEEDGIKIGATTTFSEISISPEFTSARFLSLNEMTNKITPQVRSAATIGGALCCGVPYYDMPTVILGLGAMLKIKSVERDRVINIDDFFVDSGITAISPDEILFEVQLESHANSGSAFMKIGRVSVDIAMVNCAALVQLDESKTKIESVRISLGAVANTPVRSKEAEQIISGKTISQSKILEAAKASANFDPVSSIHASSIYKKRIIPILIRDSLTSAIQRAGGKIAF